MPENEIPNPSAPDASVARTSEDPSSNGLSSRLHETASTVSNQAAAMAATAREQAIQAAAAAKERTSAAASAVRQTATTAKDQVVQAAANTKDQVVATAAVAKDQVVTAATAAKDQVTQTAGAATAQVVGKISDVGNRVTLGVSQAKSLLAENSGNFAEAANFVSIESESDRIKRKNLFYVSASIGFVWMLFHFTVVFFFGLELKSAALVGIFLGIGNVLALALDVPVGILQRYFYAKRLYLFAAVSQLLAALVFLDFIYSSGQSSAASSGGAADLLSGFLSSGFNLLLLVLASLFYGFTKEVNDITTLSYILNNSDPSEYSSILSRNNIFAGAGSLIGLVASGVVLGTNPTAAVLVLIAFILLLIAFIFTYFDNSERTIDFSAVTKLKIIARTVNVESMKEYAVGYVSKADFSAIAKSAKFVFLRPMRDKAKFDRKELVADTKKELRSIRATIVETPRHFGMLWAAAVVLAFGFWDTFAISFLVEYLEKLSSKQWAFVMLATIAIPAFVMQDPFIRLSKRIGNLPVVLFGIALSAGSLFFMSFAETKWAFLALGVCNSIGYAAGMGISQGAFLDLYNGFYAKKFDLSEIDSNASASPMKMLQNAANVVGLCLGGLLLAIFGFEGFFAVFGLALIVGAVASFRYRKMIAE